MSSTFTSSTCVARPVVGEAPRSRSSDRERRVVHRAPCRLQWWDIDSNQSAACVGQTTNLSARGLAVQISQRMLTGTRVEALLPNPSGEPTRVTGTVVHCRRILADTFEVGIRFVDQRAD
jgi:hypothetical protein